MKKTFTTADKAKAALAAVQGLDSLAVIGSKYEAHPVQIGMWKKKLLGEAHTLFDITNSSTKKIKTLEEEVDELHRIIGQRDAELEWLKKKSGM